MNMNDSEDTKYGECRCCFSLGQHRDLKKVYELNGSKEVYCKIFLDCFNLFLSDDAKKSTLICASCILRLRDAYDFKKMVLKAETSLLRQTFKKEETFPQSGPTSTKQMETFIEVKAEPVDATFESSDDEQSEANSDSDHFLSKGTDKTKSNKKDATTKQETTNSRTEKQAYIYNATTIFESSNVAPFNPTRPKGFSCFFCRKPFNNLDIMREHQKSHTKLEMNRSYGMFRPENFLLYVDVTNLKCTICDSNIPNLNELKTHIVKAHDKKLENCSDRIIPFKMASDFECQVCGCNYETFGAIERHMNVHFRNYVCKECGTGYMTKCRLRVHTKLHAGGSFTCDTCQKVYNTQLKLKSHIDVVHKSFKRFKCSKCEERFTEYFRRQKHMTEVHGVAPLEYKCNVCDKVFDRKYSLSMHMKKNHLDERDYQCEMCSYSCYTKKELKVHMIKHNGERIHECTVCKKSYARKKTLREHMRIHNNDRRFACKVCGQAFVQNCSLKGHIKTHHPELLNS